MKPVVKNRSEEITKGTDAHKKRQAKKTIAARKAEEVQTRSYQKWAATVRELDSAVSTLIVDLESRQLLDKTLIVAGSPMGDPNLHNHKRCPLFLAGGANGRLPKGGLHVKAPDGTPMANVLLSSMHMLGMDDFESFGDSTAAFPLSTGRSTSSTGSPR